MPPEEPTIEEPKRLQADGDSGCTCKMPNDHHSTDCAKFNAEPLVEGEGGDKLWSAIENLRGYRVKGQTSYLAHIDAVLGHLYDEREGQRRDPAGEDGEVESVEASRARYKREAKVLAFKLETASLELTRVRGLLKAQEQRTLNTAQDRDAQWRRADEAECELVRVREVAKCECEAASELTRVRRLLEREREPDDMLERELSRVREERDRAQAECERFKGLWRSAQAAIAEAWKAIPFGSESIVGLAEEIAEVVAERDALQSELEGVREIREWTSPRNVTYSGSDDFISGARNAQSELDALRSQVEEVRDRLDPDNHTGSEIGLVGDIRFDLTRILSPGSEGDLCERCGYERGSKDGCCNPGTRTEETCL